MASPIPIPTRREVFSDPDTGREIWRISSPDMASVGQHMYVASFTPDERYLFYSAMFRGSMQIFRYGIESDETFLMTRHRAGLPVSSWNVHPDGRELFFFDGACCNAIDVDSGARREVLDASKHAWMIHPSIRPRFTASGRFMCVGYQDGPGRMGIALAACDGSALEQIYHHEGEFDHLTACPASDRLLSFQALPDLQDNAALDERQRAHIWLVDGNRRDAEPLLTAPVGSRLTHTYWSANGSRLYFHRSTVPDQVPTAVGWMVRRTRELHECYESAEHRLGHSFVTRDGRWLLSDTLEPGRNPLLLIQAETGEAETLCWPNSANRDNGPDEVGNHVHPSISPRGRYAIYTSDSSGTPQVYLTPLPETCHQP